MSSSLTLTFTNEVRLDDWMDFCREHGISYRQNTIGQSTFYGGSTQISLSPDGTIEEDEMGRPIWETARPPSSIKEACVSTYFCGDLVSVGEVINEIASRFSCTASGAPELAHLILDIPQTYQIYEADEFISTDFVDAWSFSEGAYSATVQAGDARVTPAGENWVVELSGVKRGTFVDLNQAFAFASRAYWDWWYGERPVEKEDVKLLGQF